MCGLHDSAHRGTAQFKLDWSSSHDTNVMTDYKIKTNGYRILSHLTVPLPQDARTTAGSAGSNILRLVTFRVNKYPVMTTVK